MGYALDNRTERCRSIDNSMNRESRRRATQGRHRNDNWTFALENE